MSEDKGVIILLPSMVGREEKLTDLLVRITPEVNRNNCEIILVQDERSMRFFPTVSSIHTSTIGYWRCLNEALEGLPDDQPFLYTADDIMPDEGWLDIAIKEWYEKIPHGIGLLCLNDGHVRDHACGHGITTKNYLKVIFGQPFFPEQFEHLYLDTLVNDRAKEIGEYWFCENAQVHHHNHRIGNIEQDEVSKRNEARARGDKNRKDAMDMDWKRVEKNHAMKRKEFMLSELGAMTPELLNQQNTYATHDEIDYLREHAWELMPVQGTFVMIGAGPGVLLFSLLDSEVSTAWDITIIDINSVHYCKEHMRLAKKFIYDYVEKINWIEGIDSWEVGLGWDKPIDFLIIDGDHTERGIRRDMDVWLEHIAPGGYVLFHDYQYKGTIWEHKPGDVYPCVKPFVDERMNNDSWVRVSEFGASALFRRE